MEYGKKITVDSATLMNKVLEFVEAQKLFNLPTNKLEIIIHLRIFSSCDN